MDAIKSAVSSATSPSTDGSETVHSDHQTMGGAQGGWGGEMGQDQPGGGLAAAQQQQSDDHAEVAPAEEAKKGQ